MTNKDFNTLFDETVAACAEITRVKGNDYTDGEDKLYNFKKVAEFVGITPEQVWAVYAAKHFLAIMSYCRDGKVESEPINERLHDLINYAMLLKALVWEKQELEFSDPIESVDNIFNLINAEQQITEYLPTEIAGQQTPNEPAQTTAQKFKAYLKTLTNQ